MPVSAAALEVLRKSGELTKSEKAMPALYQIGYLHNLGMSVYNIRTSAEIAQLVERLLAKEEVAGSSPVFRSLVSSVELW
jgi:hypothetical protein